MTAKLIAKTLEDLASSGLAGPDLLAEALARHPGATHRQIARAAMGAITDPFPDPALPTRPLYDLAIALLRSSAASPAEGETSAEGDAAPPHPADAGPSEEAQPLPATAGTEIELKLVAPPGVLAGIDRSPALQALARNRGTVRHLRAVYYDTPDFSLRDAGLSLRVRQSGQQIVQTVKQASERGGAQLGRGEWEAALPDDTLNLEQMRAVLPAEIMALLTRRPLAPVFATRVSRHRRLLDLPGGVVELAFDQGRVLAGERAEPIEEIELELKAGNAAVLYDVALRLSQLGPVRLSARTKAERGYDLVGGQPLTAARPIACVESAETATDEAIVAILRTDLRNLVINQAVVEEGRNPDGVHQMRVALRRLRSALTLLRSLAPSAMLETLRAEAKWLADSLAGARSWDVFLSETLPPIAEQCHIPDGFEALRQQAEARRDASYAAARAAIADPRASRFAIALGAWIEQRGWRVDVRSEDLAVLAAPMAAFAGPALAQRHRKALRRGRRIKHMSAPARHELRLAVKKLRYQIDFFAAMFPNRKQAKTYVRSLGRLQDGLGRYNDVATTRHLVDELAAAPLPTTAQLALGAIIGWQACDLPNVERSLRGRWRAFRHAGTPWTDG